MAGFDTTYSPTGSFFNYGAADDSLQGLSPTGQKGAFALGGGLQTAGLAQMGQGGGNNPLGLPTQAMAKGG